MTPPVPPPLPRIESAVATYLKALGTLFPTLLVWIFARSFMLPKLEWLWTETNLGGSQLQWLIGVADLLTRNMQFIIGAVGLLFIGLEVWSEGWPRFRSAVVSVFTVLVHSLVLLGVTAIGTAVLVAAPLLTRTKAPKAAIESAPAEIVR